VLSTAAFWLVSLNTEDGADERVLALMDEAEGITRAGAAPAPAAP